MKKRKLTKFELEFWRRYHISGCSNIHRIKINALAIHPQNSYEHERAKFDLYYKLRREGHNIITEAVRNDNGRRVDLVDITGRIEYEIETDKKRAERFKGIKGVVVIKLWD